MEPRNRRFAQVPTRYEHAEGNTAPPRYGEGWADLAGSQTPGMHGNIVCGTREALHLTWPIAARSARKIHTGARP